MPEFKYTARNADGTESTGTVFATNEDDVRKALTEMGREPLFIQSTEPTPVITPDTFEVETTSALKEQWQPLQDLNTEPEYHETIDTVTPLPADNVYVRKDDNTRQLYPFSDTVRLYAGWLLAWYGLVYILGYYQMTRSLNPEIPYVYGLLYSPLVLTLATVCFAFLAVQSFTRALRMNIFLKALTWILAISAVVAFRYTVPL